MGVPLSIIVPIYNVEEYLESCIESIRSQTYTEFELLLVNDGSVDSSKEICDQFSLKDNRIKVIHKSNGGVSSARNVGIDNAKGDYLIFIDPDDTIKTNMLEALMNTMKRFNPDIVVCPIKTINKIHNETTISTIWSKTNSLIEKETIEMEIIPEVLNGRFYSLLQCYNKIYNKQIFEQHKIKFDESKNHGEDARMNLTLLQFINSIVFIKEPLYNYYIRSRKSLSQAFNKEQYQYLLDNKNFGRDLCWKYNCHQVMDKITNHFIISTISHMQDVVLSDLTVQEKKLVIKEIMYDTDFIKHITNFRCPSLYSKLLKRVCKHKMVNLFIKIVKLKTSIES